MIVNLKFFLDKHTLTASCQCINDDAQKYTDNLQGKLAQHIIRIVQNAHNEA